MTQELRLLRRKTNLSQKEFGKLVGMDQSSVSSIERGELLPTTPTRRRIEIFFDTQINWLEMYLKNIDTTGCSDQVIEVIDWMTSPTDKADRMFRIKLLKRIIQKLYNENK